MSLRPSSLPMLAQCPSFESGSGNDYTEAGIGRHEAVYAVLDGRGEDVMNALSPEDRESVEWAADYVKINAPMSEHPLQFERKVYPLRENFERLFPDGGTLDLSCGPHLFDFKSRPRDYRAQMAAYALAMMQETGWTEITVHVLYMVTRRYEKFVLTEAEAIQIIQTILVEIGSRHTPCDYCGWCAKQLTCPAKLEQVNAVVAGREDWKLEHTSEIKTATEMGKALTLARSLSKWCDAVEFHAEEMQTKQGITPEGYKVATSKGKAAVSDVPRAFQLAGIPQEVFFQCCDVRMNTSKKYKDRVGLADAYAAHHGIKKGAASKTIKEKLSEVIATGADGIKLVALKGDQTEEEGED